MDLSCPSVHSAICHSIRLLIICPSYMLFVLNFKVFMKNLIAIFEAKKKKDFPLPLFLTGIAAGFPSPADDYIEKQLDLNDLVIQHPTATFFVRVEGESMRDAAIFSGDILVVDRSLEAVSGKIVVAILNGEFTVKRIHIGPQGITLLPENDSFQAIQVSSQCDFQVWGVVTYVIHKAR